MTSLTTIRKSRYAVEAGNDIHTFTVGATYFGDLTCAHGQHKLVCIKRTTKTVWMSAIYEPFVTADGVVHTGENWALPRRSKVKWNACGGKQQETTINDGWMVDADGHDNSSEPNTY